MSMPKGVGEVKLEVGLTPNVDNMGVSNNQGVLWSGGEDTADVGFGVLWKPESWEYLAATLAAGKELAQSENKEICGKWKGYDCLFYPRGRGVYGWVVSIDGLELSFQNREQPAGEVGAETPNVMVHAGSIVLAKHGFEVLMRRAERLLKELGGTVLWSKLSRVDPYVDALGWACVEQVRDLYVGDCWVGRCRFFAEFRGFREGHLGWTGVQIGKGDVLLRVYDKLTEVRGDEVKRSVFESVKWGGAPVAVTRFEWQLRRDVLREFGIDTWKDWVRERGRVMRYLNERWFRLTAIPNHGSNTVRFFVHALWAAVAAAFQRVVGVGDAVAVRRRGAVDIRVDGRVRQALGCLVSALVLKSEGCYRDAQELVRDVTVLVYQSVNESVQKWVERQAELYSRLQALGVKDLNPAF